MKEPYVGSVQLVTGEIAEDITDYFARSEQTPTACALGVLVDTDQSVKCAGGYLVQLLPGAPDEVIDKIEAGIRAAGNVTEMMEDGCQARRSCTRCSGRLSWRFWSGRLWNTAAIAAASA